MKIYTQACLYVEIHIQAAAIKVHIKFEGQQTPTPTPP